MYVEELPEPVTQPIPEYPEIAKLMGIEGTVMVRLLVDRFGQVRDAYVLPKTSVPALDGAALEAVRRWVWKPALANGHAVAVWVVIPVHFSLH